MKRATTALILAALAGLSGCAGRPPVHLNTGSYRDGTGAPVDDRMIAFIKPGQRILTRDDVLLHATQPGQDHPNYWVLFGPAPGGSGAPGDGTLHSSSTTFQLFNGYALIWGLWPLAIDDVIDVGAEGVVRVGTGTCTLILQFDANRHRVFMVANPDQVSRRVHNLRHAEPDKTLSNVGTYVEANLSDQNVWLLNGPKSTAQNPEADAFVKAVMAKAAAAGFPQNALR